MLKQTQDRDHRLAAFPSTVSMYRQPPTDTVTLYEFETFALDRLKVLKAIEVCVSNKDCETQMQD